MNDANYPWLNPVPRRSNVSEIMDLAEPEWTRLLDEIALASRALSEITTCDKLNVAALGKMAAQLHVHVISGRKTDAAWPKPVWGAAPAKAYAADERDQFVGAIRRKPFPARNSRTAENLAPSDPPCQRGGPAGVPHALSP